LENGLGTKADGLIGLLRPQAEIREFNLNVRLKSNAVGWAKQREAQHFEAD
jgi:hypothetical protein